MIRTFRYQFSAIPDPSTAKAKLTRVVQYRCRTARGLYGVSTEGDGTPDMVVELRIGGHGQFEASARARREVEILARVLRMPPQSVRLVEEILEPTMRNLTVEQGRAQSYEDRTATRLRNRAERLKRFREDNEDWLASAGTAPKE